MNYKVRAVMGLFAVSLCLHAAALSVTINGGGTISPNLNGMTLAEGRIYSVTAKPNSDSAFSAWRLNNSQLIKSFTIQIVVSGGVPFVDDPSDHTLVAVSALEATFIPNPFPTHQGTYIGLDSEGLDTTAFFKITVTERGAYSGQVQILGQRIPLSGAFLGDGHIEKIQDLSSGRELYSQLDFDFANNRLMLGVIGGPTDGSGMEGKRVISKTNANIAANLAGKYTLIIPGESPNPYFPHGDAFASATISRAGIVTALGKLSDGIPFTQSVPLVEDETWPFFASAKDGREAASGWIAFSSSVTNALEGNVGWEKWTQPNDRLYPSGFWRNRPITGSRYHSPASSTDRVLNVTNFAVALDALHMLPVAELATLTPDNRVLRTSSNQFNVALQLQTGLFTGSLKRWDYGGTVIRFCGALLQDQNRGSGFFILGERSGLASLTPFQLSIIEAPSILEAGVPGNFTASVSGRPQDFIWDFGDGTIVGNTLSVSHAWSATGDFKVTLRAIYDSNPMDLSVSVIVHVAEPSLNVSIIQHGGDPFPNFQKMLTASINGIAAAYFWDCGDGTIISNSPSISHAWSSVGDYEVILRAFNSFNPGSVSATSIVHVVTESIHYVSLSSTNPLAPYMSWETAATNIQDAIDATFGTSVMVLDGLYRTGGRRISASVITNRIAITKPVVVQSANGPGVTLIEGRWGDSYPGSRLGSNAVRCAYLNNGAALVGFTLTNGATEAFGDYPHDVYGGGAWCESPDATISNCVFTGNFANSGSGLYSGTARDCLFMDNRGLHGAGAEQAVLIDCTLFRNHADDVGGGCNRSILTNCYLHSNSASGYGGGAYESVLDHCLVAANTSYDRGGGAVGIANNCIFESNSAENGGGAFYSTLNNCLIVSNLATFNGGGANDCTLNNCTILGNSAKTGGGVSQGTLNNCILIGNLAEAAQNYGSPYVPMLLNFCCTSPMPTNGIGNITNDPAFVDLAGGDFHLLPSSPCVNTGNNSYVTNNFDLDGNPRIFGGVVDMGAFELQSAPAFIPTQARWNEPERKR